MLSLRNALRYGTAPATVALIGRFTAFAILTVLVAAGIGLAISRSTSALLVIRWVGAAYLLWLGVLTWHRSRRADATEQDGPAGTEDGAPTWRLTRQEFVVAITNPKALLLFAAFLPQFLPQKSSAVAVQLLVLGFAYIVTEAVTACGYTLSGGRLGTLGRLQRSGPVIDRIAAACFVLLATYFVADSL